MFSVAKFVAVAAASLALTGAGTTPWNVDPNHTRVGFSVRHFFTPVQGQFDQFEVSLHWDPANPARSAVEARITVASVNTANEKRDNHLRSGDFFNAAAHPDIVFKSTAVRATGSDQLIASGDLTIKGVTRRIDLPVRVLGVKDIPSEMQGMLGGAKRIASFEGTLALDRRDFGVGTGSWGETAIVGGEVTIQLQLEAAER